MKLELISFRICPFVQRAVITLLHKRAPFEITYIDLANPPGWFGEISPFGKVPLLRVNDEHVIFESAVIDEFLDEITPGALLPADAIPRALDRSWIEFGTACLLNFAAMVRAGSQEAFVQQQAQLRGKMEWLEKTLGEGPWFNGQDISLVDFAYAPLFFRCRELGIEQEIYTPTNLPRTAAWANALLDLPVVKESVPEDFGQLLRKQVGRGSPFVAAAIGL